MKKIGNFYLLTEDEMDEIRYQLDLCYKYKVMAEIDWREGEEAQKKTEVREAPDGEETVETHI